MKNLILIAIFVTTTGLTLAQTSAQYQYREPASTLWWDHWYTATINDGGQKIPFAYYNEIIKKVDDRIQIELKIWKKEEGFINEEQLGAYAKDNETLDPIFYHYRRIYRTQELKITTKIINGKLTSKATLGTKQKKPFKKSLSKKTFLSYMFPVWLKKHLHEITDKKRLRYKTILEDDFDNKFAIQAGYVRKVKGKDNVYEVKYGRNIAFWTLGEDQAATSIVYPKLNMEFTRSSKQKALNFLD